MTDDKMVGWHHQLNGHEFEQAMGAGEEQGKPGVPHPMGSQRVGHNQEIEQHLYSASVSGEVQTKTLFVC